MSGGQVFVCRLETSAYSLLEGVVPWSEALHVREVSWNLGYGAYAVQSYYVTPNLNKWSHRCRGSRATHAVVLQA